MSVALNGGLGVILTSAVLETVENSRIKACVHRENANWLNRCTQRPPFFFSLYPVSTTSSFLSVQEQKAKSVFCRTLPASLWRPLHFHRNATIMCQTAGGEGDVVLHICAHAHTRSHRSLQPRKHNFYDRLTCQGQVYHFHQM